MFYVLLYVFHIKDRNTHYFAVWLELVMPMKVLKKTKGQGCVIKY